jgi:hypothetical protein
MGVTSWVQVFRCFALAVFYVTSSPSEEEAGLTLSGASVEKDRIYEE